MNFEFITSKFPFERDALARLGHFLAEHGASGEQFTFTRLCEVVEPRSREQFAAALGELVRQGILKQVVRVISPTTRGGIKDFDSLTDVPDRIHDWRADSEMEVEPDSLRIVYITR